MGLFHAIVKKYLKKYANHIKLKHYVKKLTDN